MQDEQTIAIDFDGCIHAYTRGWRRGELYDIPVPGVFQTIQYLQEKGYKIVILTVRDPAQHKAIKQWCEMWAERRGLVFKDVEITNMKPRAVAYIDDHGIRFTTWQDMANYF